MSRRNGGDERRGGLKASARSALAAMDGLLSSGGFIEPCTAAEIVEGSRDVVEQVRRLRKGILCRLRLGPGWLRDEGERLVEKHGSFMTAVHSHNTALAESLADALREDACPAVRRLDPQQLAAVTMDVRTRLVLAGAGTGKTTTVVGLIGHLLSVGTDPGEILVVSYTNSAVGELTSRIRAETGSDVRAMTIHSLGRAVIAACEDVMPRVSDMDVAEFMQGRIAEHLDDPDYARTAAHVLASARAYAWDEEDAKDPDQYRRFLEENPLVTLGGERVKSHGEAEIADWLYTHGIPYGYEDPYPVDTRDATHGQYRPDFHILGTGVYVEYFGTDRRGNVAPFMTAEDPGAARRYSEGIEWKRRTHREHGTTMVELYFYQKAEGTMTDLLESGLRAAGVEPGPIDTPKVLSKAAGGAFPIRLLAGQAALAMTLIKSSGRGFDGSFRSGRSPRERSAARRARKLLEPLYDDYQHELESRGEIDFEDMLNIAAAHIDSGDWRSPFGFVVVDEYQDMSRSRMRMIESMRSSHDFRLFCVGDDWQSIYRFNGSDVSYTVDFERWWGPAEILTLETSRRFSGQLLRCSGTFMKGHGLNKTLRGSGDLDTELAVIQGPDRRGCVRMAARKIASFPPEESVLFLGRYRDDVVTLGEGDMEWSPNPDGKTYDVRDRSRPWRKMKFMTIHGAKGLEADRVFLVNNRSGRHGFPSESARLSVTDMLFDGDEPALEEERRLFYTAMTRSRKGTYLMTTVGDESVFIKEIREILDRDSARERAADAT